MVDNSSTMKSFGERHHPVARIERVTDARADFAAIAFKRQIRIPGHPAFMEVKVFHAQKLNVDSRSVLSYPCFRRLSATSAT